MTIDRAIPVHAPVDAQMRTMAQHARERMILYPGKLAPSDLAGARRELNAIAIRLETSGKAQKKITPFTAPSLWMPGGRGTQTGRQ